MTVGSAPVPAVSVLMPVYNGAPFLRESIDSVLAQDMSAFELLIVDDSSTDDSPVILAGYRDERIVLRRNAVNRGLFANLNALARLARAPLLKTWCQDDVMQSQCLARGLDYHSRHPEVACFYACNEILVDGRTLQPPEDSTPTLLQPDEADRYALLHGCLSANVSNLFFDTASFLASGGFREDWIAADFELMVRMQQDSPIGRIPEVCLGVRRHSGQWSLQPGSHVRSIENELHIHRELRRRLVARGVLTSDQADAILTRTAARFWFHAALRLLLGGQPRAAARLLRLLAEVAPLSRLSAVWVRTVVPRLVSRFPRFGTSEELPSAQAATAQRTGHYEEAP
jgi:hypothetical protein